MNSRAKMPYKKSISSKFYKKFDKKSFTGEIIFGNKKKTC
jgi:hypothetical protein